MHEQILALRRTDPHAQICDNYAKIRHQFNINNAQVVKRADRKRKRLILKNHSNKPFERYVETDKNDAVATRPTMQNRQKNKRIMQQNEPKEQPNSTT